MSARTDAELETLLDRSVAALEQMAANGKQAAEALERIEAELRRRTRPAAPARPKGTR